MDPKVIIQKQRDFFNTGITLNYHYRIEQLSKLKKAILANVNRISEALYLDLGKSETESYMTEIGIVLSEISYMVKHLKKWMRPERVRTPITLFKGSSYHLSEPYGVTLVLSPWNYPFQLAINPLCGAIAAGNTVILKPSSQSKNTSEVINQILSETFDQEYVSCQLGDARIADILLEERLDYVFFTGSIPVGKKIMEKASKHLTPVTLELGGKSPAIIDSKMNLKLVAKRIAFGKLINAGQTCIAPDYVLIQKEDEKEFVKYFQDAVKSFFGENVLANDDYPKIINERQVSRLLNLIKNEEVAYGGTESNGKIHPTLLKNVTFDSPIMQTEIFGPILPIVTYSSHQDLISLLKTKEKPLAFYLFTNDKKLQKEYLQHLSFGGMTINDTIMHFANHHLNFGGVGSSGMGSYHGYQSFKTFSHQKSILKRSLKIDVKVRYHPYTEQKNRLFRWLLK